MPRIGNRIVKSAIAVLICFCIDLLRDGQGMPFYSVSTAIFCMQPSVSDSKQAGFNRVAATLLGGGAGVILLYGELLINPKGWMLLHYFFAALAIIPLIYITVLLKKASTAYITCVVFLSIVISHRADEIPLVFAFNRMLDTLIGILVSISVNATGFFASEKSGKLSEKVISIISRKKKG